MKTYMTVLTLSAMMFAAPTLQAAPAGDAERGASVYSRSCASCHGVQGQGNGPAARALRPPPTDFTAKRIPADRAYLVTKDGGMAAGLAPTMPGFARSLNEQELRDVTAYILSLHEGTHGGAK